MAMTTLIDMRSPSINLLRDTSNGHNSECRILSIKTEPEEQKILMHFDSKEDFLAFRGLINLVGE